jgi:tripartite ATP-independent transporter DctM subunit
LSSIGIGFASIAAVLVLLALRAPIGVALGLVSLVGIWMVRGFDVSVGTLRTIPFEFAANWSLSAIPMFILMGAVAHHSGITVALFRAARLWLGRLPGGLAVATNFACAGFAAASGSSVATSAAMGRIAIPEMIRQGYDKGLATGVVTSAGTLGALIPPSILFILYGIFAEQSITRLLIAGIVPGLLTAGIYAVMIVVRCKANPALAPKLDEQVTMAEKLDSLAPIWPLLLLITGIIGGLYSGLVTPTEAGAFGAILAFNIVATQGRLTWQVIRDSVIEATSATARLLFVAVGAILLSHLMALTGVPAYLGSIIGDYAVNPLFLVIGTSLIYIILGMFLDPLGILLLTLPILLPMFEALHLDLIWLGVLVVKYLEIGLLTPPVGFQVYVVKSVVGDEISLETIFRGVGWFLACEVVIMTLLIAFPQISLLLPDLMYN